MIHYLNIMYSRIFTEPGFWIRLFRLLSLEKNSECIEILSDLEIFFHE